jgi:hypothetical protein
VICATAEHQDKLLTYYIALKQIKQSKHTIKTKTKMKAHTTIADVLMDINTPETAKKFVVITNHENTFYFSYPGEDEFEAMRGQDFLTRTFIPLSISVHQEVGSHFIYKWDTMNEVVNHFDLLFNS